MSEDEWKDESIGRLAAEVEQQAKQQRRYRAMDYFTPYPKQAQFLATGQKFRERGFFAANQVGKSTTLAHECALHLTGLYLPDWPGKIFDRPTKIWAVGENLKVVRDVLQKKLCGEPGDMEAWGSGTIPRHLFVGEPVAARGEGLAIDTVQVRHKSGGVSTLRFRTYQAGRAALQGETLDFVVCDEEPDDFGVYTELLTRVTATNGQLAIGFTPWKGGATQVTHRYRGEFSPDRTFVEMSLDDIPADGHIRPEDRPMIIAGYSDHEREARAYGRPLMGEGLVYSTPESQIIEDADPTAFPSYWRWGWGIDLGISHPFAAVLMCHDVDRDAIHLVGEVRMSDAIPSAHVAAMKELEKRLFGRFMDFVVAWPKDAGHRDYSGRQAKDTYKYYGLRMMAQDATLPGPVGGVEARSVEGGIQQIADLERNGKWKVARGMGCYLEERRGYHRKDGQVVKIRDDTLCAARYAWSMRRYFKPIEESGGAYPGTPGSVPGMGPHGRGRVATMARGIDDWDVF
jgi:phage terminase large subunit-like protein